MLFQIRWKLRRILAVGEVGRTELHMSDISRKHLKMQLTATMPLLPFHEAANWLPASRVCFNQGASFRQMKMIAALRRMLPNVEKGPAGLARAVAFDHAIDEQALFILLQKVRAVLLVDGGGRRIWLSARCRRSPAEIVE